MTAGDSKYFARGKIQELKSQLLNSRNERKDSKRISILKKIIANATMGNDMSPLFQDVMNFITLDNIEIKKMVLLYLVFYAKKHSELVIFCVEHLVKDVNDSNPLIRALALKTMGNLPIDIVIEKLIPIIKQSLKDKDAFVCKTAAISILKINASNPERVASEGLLISLESLLEHPNATVVANAIAVLIEISSKSTEFDLVVEYSLANRLLSAIDDCSEWSQLHFIDALSFVVPKQSSEAEMLIERIFPRLQHSNSSIVLTSVRVILYLSNYIKNEEFVVNIYKKLGPPFVTLLHGTPEIQYVALRNINLILQSNNLFLRNEYSVFFCKYDDPIYLKLCKLEILCRLVTEDNIIKILSELKEYASEVDIEFVRKTIRSIGKCAIKIEIYAERCIKILIDLIQTRVSYVVQESIIVIKDIFRRYPNQYESIIGTLCENLDDLNESDAKAAMIWIIGQYSDRIDNADVLLETFLETFTEELVVVQLALLTAIVKLFIKRPSVGQRLVPKVLKFATEEADNPDLRDRGFMYWRLLSTDPITAKVYEKYSHAKEIILSEKPVISELGEMLDPAVLSELLLNISNLSTIFNKIPAMIVGGLKPRILHPSEALTLRNQLSDTANLKKIGDTDFDDKYMVKDNDAQYNAINEHVPIKDVASHAAYDPNSYEQIPDAIGPYSTELNNPFQYFNNQYVPSNANNTNSFTNQSIIGVQPQVFTQNYQQSIPQNFNDIYSVPSFNPTQENINSVYNPFGSPVNHYAAVKSTIQSPITITTNNHPSLLKPFNKPSENVVLDPFSKTSSIKNTESINISAVTSQVKQLKVSKEDVADLYSLSLKPGYKSRKSVILTSQSGKGLEVELSFVRFGENVEIELNLTNKSLQPLSDFGILFNNNTFGLSPAQPLEMKASLFPNQSVEVKLPLKRDSVKNICTPPNNIQIAFKTNVGILYCEAKISLHTLFSEKGQLPSEIWLKMWKFDIPASNEVLAQILGINATCLNDVKNKLAVNNIYLIADRIIDSICVMYLSVVLFDSTVFLSEIKMGQDFKSCTISTRTLSLHLVGCYHESIEQILIN